MPTHRVLLSVDHRFYLAVEHGGGWEIVVGRDDVDGCALVRWVSRADVLLVRAAASTSGK